MQRHRTGPDPHPSAGGFGPAFPGSAWTDHCGAHSDHDGTTVVFTPGPGMVCPVLWLGAGGEQDLALRSLFLGGNAHGSAATSFRPGCHAA